MSEGTIKQEAGKMDGGGFVLPDEEFPVEVIRDFFARYAFAAEWVEDKVVLDVACGSGYGSRYLFDKGARAVVGGDISVKAIEAAQKSHAKEGVEFCVLDATRLPFADDSFDAITSMETIEHLEQYRDFLRECKRVLKKRGVLICSTPNKGPDIHPLIRKLEPYHVHGFSLVELQELLSQSFTETQLYGQDSWHKGEQARWCLWIGTANAIAHSIHSIPFLYSVARSFRRFIMHVPCTKMSQITDPDNILVGKDKPFPMTSGSPTPKTIVAAARKCGSGNI
jgi:2-polyprenyl-3-methyl-5-hydroxy-6-metoxy-1,4-benzoquinol methylase